MLLNQTEILTKDYIADALKKVAEDVDVISSNLDEYLSRQVDAVEDISQSLNHANMRLRILKQQHGAARLTAMRQDKPPPPRGMRIREADPEAAVYEPVPLATRLEKYAAVGVSLMPDKEGDSDDAQAENLAA